MVCIAVQCWARIEQRIAVRFWGVVYKISYDYLAIVATLLSTYDRRLIYKISREERKAVSGYDSLAKS